MDYRSIHILENTMKGVQVADPNTNVREPNTIHWPGSQRAGCGADRALGSDS